MFDAGKIVYALCSLHFRTIVLGYTKFGIDPLL